MTLRARGKPQGGDYFTYTATSANLEHIRLDSAGKLVLQKITTHFDFVIESSGKTPWVLRPGDTVTVTIKGKELKTNTCWAGSFDRGYNATCKGWSVFKVPPGATKVVITLKANFAIGAIATYTWERR